MGILRKLKAMSDLALKVRPTHLRLLHRMVNMPEQVVTSAVLRFGEADGTATHDPRKMGRSKQFIDTPTQYHLWYYNSRVWRDIHFQGNTIFKSVSDLWNYQEILYDLKARLVVEFGAHAGGSALFFSRMLQLGNPDVRVFSVDITLDRIPASVRNDPLIEFMECSSSDPLVFERIAELRKRYPGPVFFIVDSDHSMAHVLKEMKGLRAVTVKGDYIIVEDGHVNGHPVEPGWGDGPYEAIAAYETEFPADYVHDYDREEKFGFTWAPRGFLIRQ